MKIWINNPFDFLPGEGARLQRYGLLAKALVKAGHQVVWWSSDWNHIKKEHRSQIYEGGMSGFDIRLVKTMPYFKKYWGKEAVKPLAVCEGMGTAGTE